MIYENLVRRHPLARSIWCERIDGGSRFTVVDPEGPTIYRHEDGSSIYTNDRTGQRHYIFRG